MASGTDLLELELPSGASAGAVARRALEVALGDRVGPRTKDHVLLVASELVNNAVLHGKPPLRILVRQDRSEVRVEVVDAGDGVPAIPDRAGDERGGFGLRIVEELSARWGAFEGTTHVWARVPIAD